MQTVTTATTKDIVLKSISRLLTDDEIKNLPTTPVEIVPAPGDGKITLFEKAIIHKLPFQAAYSGIVDLDAIRFSYVYEAVHDGGFYREDATALDDLNNLLYTDFESDTVFLDRLQNEAFSDYTRPNVLTAINQPISIKAITDSGNPFTGGHASNAIKVTVFYYIVDI